MTVTTVTSYSKRVHPTLRDAELWAELFYDATGEVPEFVGHTVTKSTSGTITATPVVHNHGHAEPGDIIDLKPGTNVWTE